VCQHFFAVPESELPFVFNRRDSAWNKRKEVISKRFRR